MKKTNWNDSLLLAQIAATSNSLSECLRKLDLLECGANSNKLKQCFEKFGISSTHFDGNRFGPKPRRSLEEIMVENSTYQDTTVLKKRIQDAGLLPRCCQRCGQGEIFMDEPLTLQLDHINGKSNDHRLENLRILCPTCHSQTKTWGNKRRSNDEVRGNQVYTQPIVIQSTINQPNLHPNTSL